MSDSLNRREFLGTAAAGSVLLAAQMAAAESAAKAQQALPPKLPPARIYKVFAGRIANEGYLSHPPEEIEKFNAYFAGIEKKLGDVKFVGGEIDAARRTSASRRQAEERRRPVDHPSLRPRRRCPVLGKLIDVGLPDRVVLAALQRPRLDGLSPVAQAGQEGHRCCPAATGAMLDRVAGLLRAAAWMRQTRILAVGRPHGTRPPARPSRSRRSWAPTW